MVKHAVGELRWMEPVIVNVKCYLQPVIYIYLNINIYIIYFSEPNKKRRRLLPRGQDFNMTCLAKGKGDRGEGNRQNG